MSKTSTEHSSPEGGDSLLRSARKKLVTGDVEHAIADLEAAYEKASAANDRRLAGESLVELARALAAQGTIDQALLCIEKAAETAREAGLPALEGEVLIAEAELLLPRGDVARAHERLGDAERLLSDAAHAARAAGQPDAALALAQRSRAAHDLLVAGGRAPSPTARPARGAAPAEKLPRRESPLVELLFETSRTLVEERDPDRVLLRVLDAGVKGTGAERGFILVFPEGDGAGEKPFDVVAARNFDRRDVARAEFKVSRTVIQRALATHEPVFVHDAGGDDELSAHTSVIDHRLRSIVCIPIESQKKTGGVRGALYLDNRFGTGTFDPQDLRALAAFAAHAAVAVESARLHRAAAEQNRALHEARARAEQLARRLEAELAKTGDELGHVRAQLDESRSRLAERSSLGEIVGGSKPMQLLYRLIDKAKDADAPVLITGESGTGKELIARAFHFESRRKGQPFVGENCAAIPETLLESTLFGHESGAFTGATARREGLFELAGSGTIFLDEIGDLSAASQVKLLRVLQEKKVRRVGGSVEVPVNPRVVCATHRDLKQMVADGRFREDLFYRLNVLSVSVPALRERRDDIPLLIARIQAKEGLPPFKIAPDAMRALLDHAWPGNIRELSNELRRLAAFATARVERADLSPSIRGEGAAAPAETARPAELVTWKEGERQLLLNALRAAKGERARAAEILALPHGTLWNKLKRHRITDADVFGGSPPA